MTSRRQLCYLCDEITTTQVMRLKNSSTITYMQKDDVMIFYIKIANIDTKKTTLDVKKIAGELEITTDMIRCMIDENKSLFEIRRSDIRLIEQIKSNTILVNFFYYCDGCDGDLHWGKQGALTQILIESDHCQSIIKALV